MIHNEEFSDLYSPPNIIRVIKSRMRWVGRIARMGKIRNVLICFIGNLKGSWLLGYFFNKCTRSLSRIPLQLLPSSVLHYKYFRHSFAQTSKHGIFYCNAINGKVVPVLN
jgi:formate/nitrite transporter FocA (FNT family)